DHVLLIIDCPLGDGRVPAAFDDRERLEDLRALLPDSLGQRWPGIKRCCWCCTLARLGAPGWLRHGALRSPRHAHAPLRALRGVPGSSPHSCVATDARGI